MTLALAGIVLVVDEPGRFLTSQTEFLRLADQHRLVLERDRHRNGDVKALSRSRSRTANSEGSL